MSYWQNNFSHIYLEKNARNYTLTKILLERYPKATLIMIDSYKEVFARPKQNFQMQKQSKKIIIAEKKDDFIYTGSTNAQNFGNVNFYYNSLILNCLYNCEYCYLQGMFPSANIVYFVNTDKFFEAALETTKSRRDKSKPLYLAISYDTDLLAFENILPYCAQWIEFVSKEKDFTIEIRTKSANYSAIEKLTPNENVILAWSLSPETVVKNFEHATPSLKQRLASAKKAISDGWSVRICIDPILKIENWKNHYTECIEQIFETLPADKIRDVSIGVFRMNSEYYKKIKKQRPSSPIIHYNYERESKNYTYGKDERFEVTEFVLNKLTKYIDREKIEVWV